MLVKYRKPLLKKIEEDEKKKIKNDEIKNKIIKIRSKLKYYSFLNNKIIIINDVYKHLKKIYKKITYHDFRDMTYKSYKEFTSKPGNKALLGIFLFEKEDICVVYEENTIIPIYYTYEKQNVFFIRDNYFEGYFDIKVYNATYCYMGWDNKLIHMDKINFDINLLPDCICKDVKNIIKKYCESTFTFFDITYENPFLTHPLHNFYFMTDGNFATYKGIRINFQYRYLLIDLEHNGGMYCTRFPSKNKAIIYNYCGKGIFNLDEIELIT